MQNFAGNLWDALLKSPGALLLLRRLWPALCEIAHALCRWICRLKRGEPPRRPPRSNCCFHLPDVYKRADPLIYAQYYLMKMGLAVTWDNPDIQLYDGNTPVSSSALKRKHTYRVRVQVWNGSYDAPAVGLVVHLSYLSFGVGASSTVIGSTIIDLGVKGSPHCPAFAWFNWETPDKDGHYCLQARLDWADDANPDNNLGQENTNVGTFASPAQFSFLLRNEASVRRAFVLEADTYRLPDLPRCDDARLPPVPDLERPDRTGRPRQFTRLAESRARWQWARQLQAYGAFVVPDDWTVSINPSQILLAPGAEQTIDVSIEPKTAAASGPKVFNVHAFATREGNLRELVGGVTLSVNKA